MIGRHLPAHFTPSSRLLSAMVDRAMAACDHAAEQARLRDEARPAMLAQLAALEAAREERERLEDMSEIAACEARRRRREEHEANLYRMPRSSGFRTRM